MASSKRFYSVIHNQRLYVVPAQELAWRRNK